MQPDHKSLLITASLFALSAFSAPVLAKNVTQEIEDTLNLYHYGKNGAVKVDLNYRWENVNQDSGPQHTANANTLRMRLGLLSPVFHGLQGYVEYEGNLAMQEDYNSTRNGNTGYSVVADPEKSELNQFWVSYDGLFDTVAKIGRQRIKLDDDRFIGNVGWRQMEMTYDSVLLTHKSQQIFGLTVNAGYIWNSQTIFATTENLNAPFLNVNYNIADVGNLIGYGYWLDYTEKDTKEKSSQTYGISLTNAKKPYELNDKFGLIYTAEYSYQSELGDATNYEADRYNVMGGFTAYNFTFAGAMEQLDGKGANKTFDTPLGTNHAFQGWADLFLATPANGIRDVNVSVTGAFDQGNTKASFIYHDFSDDTGSLNYGNEYDAIILKKFGKHYSVMAKYAYYDAASFGTDTQKIWLQANINF